MSMRQREIVLCNPVRTAIGTFDGSLKTVPAAELGSTVVRAALSRARLNGSKVGGVVMGNVIQAGNKMNPARQSGVDGGIPVDVPAMTVNRVCGSGAQAIASAAQEIMLGLLDCAVAGGMENMDMAPYLMGGGRWGYRLGDAQIYDSMLRDGLNDAFSGEHSGWHTEDLVKSRQIVPQGWHDHRWQCAGIEQWRGGHGRCGAALCRQAESRTYGAVSVVRRGCRGAGHVRAWSDTRGATGARTCRLEDQRHRADRNQ
jgi:hypothetical protein